jgi:hypothetical protein
MTQHPSLASFLTASLLLLATVALAGCDQDLDSAGTFLEVRFAGQATDLDSSLDTDLDSRPTAAQYDRDGIPHPDGFTAHDQLELWSQTGHTYNATSYPDTGFGAGYFLTDIEGIAGGASAYWSLAINGVSSDVGMSEAILHDGDTVTWTLTSLGGATNDPDPIGVTVDQPAPTQGETTTVTGSVNHPALVSIDGGPSLDVKGGRWTLTTQKLDFGRTPGVVRVDDGVHSVTANVTFVRLASATISAEFASAVPPRAAIEDTFWFDVDAYLSAPQYEAAGIQHPPHANVHDAMVAWGHEVEYSGPGDFGFGVESIEGHGALSDWCYDINGASASLGITDMQFTPGDVIAWHGCFGV